MNKKNTGELACRLLLEPPSTLPAMAARAALLPAANTATASSTAAAAPPPATPGGPLWRTNARSRPTCNQGQT